MERFLVGSSSPAALWLLGRHARIGGMRTQRLVECKGSNGAGSGSSAGIGSGMGKHGQFDVEVMVTDGNLIASPSSTRARRRAWAMWPWKSSRS
ncbi:MAG: hypothetical protein ACLSVD_10100 [Eggerthellaceae bacterium]